MFEGNAQGFRTLTRLQMPENKGGMQLTIATLGAFTKYPRSSIEPTDRQNDTCLKKHGFFQDDLETFQWVANELGLIKKDSSIHEAAWGRHPLAFLVEAADDICYTIVDLEDGFVWVS